MRLGCGDKQSPDGRQTTEKFEIKALVSLFALADFPNSPKIHPKISEFFNNEQFPNYLKWLAHPSQCTPKRLDSQYSV